MKRCPECKKSTGRYKWLAMMNPDIDTFEDYPLYQRTYKGEPEYISPRCLRCYDKALSKERRRPS